jgi:hypothetical protein
MYYITGFCDRALWLREGRVEQLGDAKSIVEAYEAYMMTREKRRLQEKAPEEGRSADRGAQGARVGRIRRLEVQSGDGAPADELRPGDRLEVLLEVESVCEEEVYHVGVALDALDGRCVLGVSTVWDGCDPLRGRASYTVRLVVPELPLASGAFHLSGFLLDESGLHVHDQVVVTEAVRITPERWTPSLVETPHSWDVQ